MELKEKFLSSFFAFRENFQFVDSPTIESKRYQALCTFEENGFPTRKLESWKYTSLNSIIKEDYTLYPTGEVGIHPNEVKKYFLYELDTYKLVFIDGVFSTFLSNTYHGEIDVNLLSVALSHNKFQSIVEKHFSTIAPIEESLVSLNTSYAHEGAYIHIPENCVSKNPIEIIHLSSGDCPSLWSQPRNLIVIGKNAEVQIIERHQSLKSHPVVTNSVTEIFAEQDARVDYYKVQDDLATSTLIDNTYIEQKRGSDVSVHTTSLGGNIVRNNLNFYQRGERINSNLKGLTVLKNNQHVDHSTLVHHSEPNCESHQDYKGIFSGQSIGVFNGKILVDKIAQKTNAFQQNNNILLSDKAQVNAKPQLEIFADDVRCSHGCTIGQLNQEALFYARVRGIPKKEAEALLTYAFANKVLDSVSIPILKKHINQRIASKFGVDMGFAL